MIVTPILSVLTHAAVAATLTAGPQQTPAPAVREKDPLVVAAEGHVHVGELGAKALFLEKKLRCNCGCGLDLHSCQFQMQCGTSPVWSARIRDMLKAGESTDAIEAAFVADFGQTVLMAPPATGFNLVGYLLPSLAIVSAGMLVGLIIRAGPKREPVPVPEVELTEEERARLAAELKHLDEMESPDF